MSKYKKSLESFIIGHKKYQIAEKYLLCTATISRDGLLFDMRAKTKKLYYASGKAFLLVTAGVMTGTRTVEVLTEMQARQFMDKHPEGINESVYIKYMGKPAEI